MAFRFGTWNLHEGVPDHDLSVDARMSALDEVIGLVDEHDLDVLAFQEVDIDTDGHSRVLAAVCERTDLRHSCQIDLSESTIEPGQLSGLAIASRYPVSSVTTHLLPNPGLEVERNGQVMRSFRKGMLMCDLDVEGERVGAASLHSYPFHRFESQAEDVTFRPIWRGLAKKLSKRAQDGPLVVGGDFNTATRSLVLNHASAELSRGIGDIPTHRGLPMDDVLYAGLVQVGDPQVIPNYSDHHFCVVELAMR